MRIQIEWHSVGFLVTVWGGRAHSLRPYRNGDASLGPDAHRFISSSDSLEIGFEPGRGNAAHQIPFQQQAAGGKRAAHKDGPPAGPSWRLARTVIPFPGVGVK